MAISDANYRFLMCDVGINGRVSDGGAIENTEFFSKLLNGQLNIPLAKSVVNGRMLNYVFVGDEAFALKTNFLKPYSQKELNYERRIYNYRLSRARRIVENLFGIFANRFRVFHSAINLKVATVDKIVLASCALHNFLLNKSSSNYIPKEDFDAENPEKGTTELGLRSDSLVDLQRCHARNASEDAKSVRVSFMEYFNNEGAVPWQNNMI